MMTRGWIGDTITATTRGQCEFYVGQRTSRLRPGVICKRIGTKYLTVGNLHPLGPYCLQHALTMQDRATATTIGSTRIVRLHEVTE